MKQSTIRNIKDHESSLIAVHWKSKEDTPVCVKVRELSDLQIQAIGNFSLINRGTSAPITDWRDISNLAELQHNIVRAALVSPTYEQICKIAGLGDFAKTVETKYNEVKKEIAELPVGPVRSGWEKQLESTRLLFNSVLPNVFCSEISEYVLGANRTNIKLVTDEIILNAAILQSYAKSGRISDFIQDGTLTAFNKRDIDTRGMTLFTEWLEKNKKKA